MAKAPVEALEYAKQFVKNMPLERVGEFILRSVHEMLWMAYPWRWTVGTYGEISLVANQQDYTLTAPTDFLYVQEAYLTGGTDIPSPIHIEAVLPTAVTLKGWPTKLAYIPNNTVRLMPVPGSIPNPAPKIILLYKKAAPLITPASMHTAGFLQLPNEWFWVYEAGVLWQAYMYADDQRAGSVQLSSSGQAQYSGQRAIFESGIQMMKEREPLPLIPVKLAQEGKGIR